MAEQGFKEIIAAAQAPAVAVDTAPAAVGPVLGSPPPGVVWNNGTVREIGKAPTPAQLQAVEKRFLAAEDLDD